MSEMIPLVMMQRNALLDETSELRSQVAALTAKLAQAREAIRLIETQREERSEEFRQAREREERIRAALLDLLEFGAHEGTCTNTEKCPTCDSPVHACSEHRQAMESRVANARAALAVAKEPDNG